MKKGFTLIEMIVVIAILAILSSIVIPNISSFKGKSITAEVSSSTRSLQTAVDLFSIEHNDIFPTKEPVTLDSPQLIDFDQMYPKYIKSLPKLKEEKYWVDTFGKVWGSTLEVPQNVSEFDSKVIWDNAKDSLGYHIYEVTNSGSQGAVKGKVSMNEKFFYADSDFDIVSYPKDADKTYLISAIDQYGLETAPVGIDNVVFDSTRDVETGELITFPITKPGTYTMKIGSGRLAHWDGVVKSEEKPEGTDIKYSYATSMDGKTYSSFVENIEELDDSNYIRIKVDLITNNVAPTGSLANTTATVKPSVKSFKMLFHYVLEESEMVPLNYEEEVEDAIDMLVFPSEITMENNTTAASATFVMPLSLDSPVYVNSISTPYTQSEGTNVVITYQTSSDGRTWSPASSNPAVLPAGKYIRVSVSMKRDYVSLNKSTGEIVPYTPENPTQPLATTNPDEVRYLPPSPIVLQPQIVTSMEKQAVQVLNPSDASTWNGSKGQEGDYWQTLETFDIGFDSGEPQKWTKADISDYQPNGTKITYSYNVANIDSYGRLVWGRTAVDDINKLSTGSAINVHIVRSKLKSAKVEPEFYELSLDYEGLYGTTQKVVLTGNQLISLQKAVDKYYAEHHTYPSNIQPTTTKPEKINFSLIRWPISPIKTYANYWVDYKGKVWISTLDYPTGINVVNVTMTWNPIAGATSYNVYEVTDGQALSAVNNKQLHFVKNVTTNQFVGVAGKTYVVTSIDNQNKESAPSNEVFVRGNHAPIAVIKTVPDNNQFYTVDTVQWKYDSSTDVDGDQIKASEWKFDGVSVTTPPSKFNTTGPHYVELRVQDTQNAWSEWKRFDFTVVKRPINTSVPAGWIGVYTAQDLFNMRNNMTGKYILMNDIDLNVAPYNEGEGWRPIADGASFFYGQLDGNGLTISNLYINRPTKNFQSLLGYTKGITVKNLGIENVNITGGSYTGGLAGQALEYFPSPNRYAVGISDVYVTGTIKGASYTGGLVGDLGNGSLTRSYVDANITGTSYVAGIAGESLSLNMNQVFTKGSVTGTSSYVGGIVGYTNAMGLVDSYSTADITGVSNTTGGLIGYDNNYPTLGRSYYAGKLKSSGAGGVVGNTTTYTGRTASNFYDKTLNPNAGTNAAQGKTTTEMQTQSVFATGWGATTYINPVKWDFTNTWVMHENSYPTLRFAEH